MKVILVNDYGLKFEDGSTLYSDHDQDCCEHHYLDFSALDLQDFEGLEFDLSIPDLLIEKVEDYGIRLVPINGHPVSIPGYGYNNGYYSANLTVIIENTDRNSKLKIDISECQEIKD